MRSDPRQFSNLFPSYSLLEIEVFFNGALSHVSFSSDEISILLLLVSAFSAFPRYTVLSFIVPSCLCGHRLDGYCVNFIAHMHVLAAIRIESVLITTRFNSWERTGPQKVRILGSITEKQRPYFPPH